MKGGQALGRAHPGEQRLRRPEGVPLLRDHLMARGAERQADRALVGPLRRAPRLEHRSRREVVELEEDHLNVGAARQRQRLDAAGGGKEAGVVDGHLEPHARRGGEAQQLCPHATVPGHAALEALAPQLRGGRRRVVGELVGCQVLAHGGAERDGGVLL